MNIKKFREIIKQRATTDDEWSYGVELCWEQEIEILTENISETIDFLKHDCTADEYSWISEVLEDVVEVTPSKELLQCYKELMSKFPEECSKYNIVSSIEGAEEILRWEAENEEKY